MDQTRIEEAKTLALLADFYMSIEKYHEAADCYQKGLPIAGETGDKTLEWNMCVDLVDAYGKLGQHNDVMKYSKQCLDIALRTGESNRIAYSYYNLGHAYCSLYEYQNTVKCYNKAINMFKQLGDEEGLGNCYINLSNSYIQQGKYHDAIKFLEESLRISDKIGNKEGKADSLLNLGDVHETLNNHKEAVDLLQQSLAIAKEINCKGIQGKCYNNLGNVLCASGNFQDAISYYLESLTIAGELGDKQTQDSAVSANLNIGNCYQGMNLYQEAIEYYNNSLVIAKEINKKETEAFAYHNMAYSHLRCCEFQQAISMSEKSLDIAFSISNKELEACACHLLGEIYHSLDKNNKDHETHVSYTAKSEEYLKMALDCYDYLFSHLRQRDHLKISIFDKFIKTYKLLTTVLIETQQTQQALLVTDSGRARALGDCLIFRYGMSQEEYLSSEPLTYPDVENVLSNDTFTLLHYSLLDDSLVVWVLSKDLMEFEEIDKQQFVSTLKTFSGEVKKDTFNRLFAGTVDRAYKDMEIKEGGENRSLDDCVTPEEQQCDGVTESLSRGGTSMEEPWQNSHSLEVLYNVLVAPVLSHIQHDNLVIVPDGKMYTVPFAALKDPNNGQYLSETKRIRLVPSISILKVLQECPVDHHSQQGALIVGNPSVGKVMFRAKEATWGDLPGAEKEVSKIIKTLHKASNNEIANPNITSLAGEHATKDVVLAKLKEGAAIIHIAAHGSSDYGEILLSPISSSTSSGLPEEQDYLLTMQEVQQVGIKAQLVVLSCCHSGRGKIRAEGMVGLSRAFLAAGARAVVASLWGINDKKTRKFMGSFYKRLKQGRSAILSLDGALKDFRKRHSDPKYWAPFFLIGDDVTIKFGQ